nr:MAG TPA: hypothetical protein [Caudoviricetes sp.]
MINNSSLLATINHLLLIQYLECLCICFFLFIFIRFIHICMNI